VVSVFWKWPTDFCIWGITVRVVIIYRLNPSKKNGLKAADFFWKSSETNIAHLLILCDFNIHWGCQKNADTKELDDFLRSANLRQHVQERTHKHGYILDFVIYHDGDYLIKGVSVSSFWTLMYLNRTNMFQLKLFHTENIAMSLLYHESSGLLGISFVHKAASSSTMSLNVKVFILKQLI